LYDLQIEFKIKVDPGFSGMPRLYFTTSTAYIPGTPPLPMKK